MWDELADANNISHADRQLWLNNPAVRKTGWLPQGLWSELDVLAERHELALAGLAEAAAEARDLGAKYEAEDAERIAAYKNGLKVPKMTDPAEREHDVAIARAKVDAARLNMVEVINLAIEGIQEHADAWMADLTRQRVEAEAKRAEAKRLLEESYEGLGQIKATEHWIERTAEARRGRHIAHGEVPVGQPYDPREDLAAILGADGGDAVPEVVGA